MTAGSWQSQGLCLGSAADFFVERSGDNGFQAKRLCASCPVRADCLAHAVETNAEWGITGGAGDGVRRLLRRAWRQSGHDQARAVDGCECPSCAAFRDHFDRLDTFAATGSQPAGARKLFGPGARHGKLSTAKKGCPCRPCKLALAMASKFDRPKEQSA